MAPPSFSNGMDDAPATNDNRARMIAYIKKNFSELLGTDAELLDAPGGLDALAQKFHAKFWRDI